MAVPGISHQLFASVFISSAAQAPGSSSIPQVTADDLFVAAMSMYLNTLHNVVMQSWRQFSEATQATAENNAQEHRSREVRRTQEEASRLEGQRRQIALNDTPTDDLLFPDAVRRQAGKLRYHQGMHTGDSDRHLNLPV